MSIIDELENAIDIIDLVWKYAKLKKAWANYKSLCPFPWHNEKTPSFVVSPSKQIAYCFWCHKWWWAIKFIMDIENCEFKDAVEILWNLTWIKVNSFQNKSETEIKAEKSLYSLYKLVNSYYKTRLDKYLNIKKYFFDRWLNAESLDIFSLWYSDDWISLYNFLKDRWFDDSIIKESNIFLDLARRKDKFIWRIIFPIKNHRWDVVAFAWRILDKWEPKYINSSVSKIYDKSNILYGFHEARNEITKKDFVIITEWYMDTISLHQYGFKNTLAVSWTALTEKHLKLLKRLTRKIYLCFDWDKAWQQATKLALELLKNKWFEVKIIILPWWKDPDDLLKSGEDFQNFIETAVSPVVYYLKNSDINLKSIDDKKNSLKEILEILKTYTDNIEKDFYIKEISKILDIPTNLIYEELNKIPNKREEKQEEEENIFNITSEDYAIAYILIDETFREYFMENLAFKDYLWSNLKSALEDKDFLKKLSLEKKEFYRWLSLEQEEKDSTMNIEKIKLDIKKLCKKIDLDIYKTKLKELKEEMLKDKNNKNLEIEYIKLVGKAKKLGIN